MAIPLSQQDQISAPDKDPSPTNSDFDVPDEMEEIQESLADVNWTSIIELQLALNRVELSDRLGFNTGTVENVGKEVVEFLNTMGIVVNGTNLTWETLDGPLFSLAYDVLLVVKLWWCDLHSTHAWWFADMLCPLGTNREHLLKICNFLISCGLKIHYISTEKRVIQRLVLFVASPSWEPCQHNGTKYPIDQLLSSQH